MLRDQGRESIGFCLQWHLTNECDANCAHCYDRTNRKSLTYAEALAVVDDLVAFGRLRQVHCGINLTGGNPLLYPHFFELYEAIDRAGLSIGILGNPVPQATLARISDIQRPVLYQLSLEGLPEHNDRIRGPGHFDRVLACLADLRSLEIRSHIMLTLTSDNLDQVLALTELLQGHADRFTFTRLIPVGNGSRLAPPERSVFISFLRDYLHAAQDNPLLGTKDNLFNLLRYQHGKPLGGGCSGFGCGAAFDGLVLLPDGEVHVCRKFPSPIGDIRQTSWETIYTSTIADRYRHGPDPCRSCPLFTVCGSCLAATYGEGGDFFNERDPYCFMENDRSCLGNSALLQDS